MEYTRRKFVKDTALGILGVSGLSAFGAVVPEITASGKQNKLVTDDEIILYRRSVWADFKPRLNRLHKAGTFSKITIHHAGARAIYHTNRNSVICDIDAVYTSHMNRNYGDIGYHFIIDYAGRIWEGRSLSYEGAHVCHYNRGNIGIMLLGNFEKQKPSALQVSAMKKLTVSLKKKYAVKSENIFGHCDIGQSLCPGKNLYPHVLKLRKT